MATTAKDVGNAAIRDRIQADLATLTEDQQNLFHRIYGEGLRDEDPT